MSLGQSAPDDVWIAVPAMLTACPECHGQLSTRAEACPHCGYAPRRERRGRRLPEGPGRGRPQLSLRSPRDGSLAPLFLLVAAPLVLAIALFLAMDIALFAWLGLSELAVFASIWAVACIAEMFAVPLAAKGRGRDPGIWFVVTIIWLCFDTFLAVVAHLAGFVTLRTILHASENGMDPGTALLGVGGILIAGFIVYLPLWTLLLSARKAWNPSDLRGRRRVRGRR